ncbi:MAG: hypothetical protein FWG63_02350 [Defluviitaleaceae bacterium]|nr:hypothetical protein [Defluviitaleaceae bacterium]
MEFLISELNGLEGPSILREAGIIKNESVKYNANRIIGNLINNRDYDRLFDICAVIEQKYEDTYQTSKKSQVPIPDINGVIERDRVAWQLFKITFNKCHPDSKL